MWVEVKADARLADRTEVVKKQDAINGKTST